MQTSCSLVVIIIAMITVPVPIISPCSRATKVQQNEDNYDADNANNTPKLTLDCLITEMVSLLDSEVVNEHEDAKDFLQEKFTEILFRNGTEPFSKNEQGFYNLVRNLINQKGKINEWALEQLKNISLGETQTPQDIEIQIQQLRQDLDALNLKLTQDIDAINLKLSQDSDALNLKLTQNSDAINLKLNQDLDAVNLKLQQDLDSINSKLSKYMTMTPISPISIPTSNGIHNIPDNIPQNATHILLWCWVQTGTNQGDIAYTVKLSNSLGHTYIFEYHRYPQNAWSYNSDNIWMEVCQDRTITVQGAGTPPLNLQIAGYK